MKKIFTLLLVTLVLGAFSQIQKSEIAPGVKPEPSLQEDTFNLLFSFPTDAFYYVEYGIESDGTTIYTTQWAADSIAAYDQSGAVLDRFVIPGAGKMRDLAYDGQYYYGSPNNFYFYVLDMDNKTLINTVNTTFKIRGMAYDPVEDVLWASEHWSPSFYKMDKQGNILESWIPSGITMDAISGLAFDNNSPGGPFLWGFSQDSTAAMIVKYDIPNQTQTGNMIDVSTIPNGAGYAGGLYLHEMDERGVPALAGLIQDHLVFALELEYANMLVGLEENDKVISVLEVFPNPARDVLNITTDVEISSVFIIRVVNQLGQGVMETSALLDKQTPIAINVSDLEEGIYFLQLTTKGQSITKKFLKTE